MQPSDAFWDGVGQGLGDSPWWALLGVIAIIALAFLTAKYIYPGHKEIKMRELDIRQREADNDSERIKANAALAENMRGLRESNDQLAQQSAALAAGIEESKARSRGMGDDVSRIRATTDHTAEQVEDIHRHLFREGTD